MRKYLFTGTPKLLYQPCKGCWPQYLEKWADKNIMKFNKVHSPVPGEEQLQAPTCAQGNPAGKQLGRAGPGAPGVHQAEHEPATCPCTREGE